MNIIYLIFITAICWGGWPLLTRLSGVDGAVYAPIITTIAITFPFCYFFVYAQANTVAPVTIQSLAYLIPAGLIMGLGVITFSMVLQSTTLDISSSIPIINSAVLIITLIGGAILFNDSISLQKICGIVAILIGIYLLRPIAA